MAEYDLDALTMETGDDGRVLNMVTLFRDTLPEEGAGRTFVQGQMDRFNRDPKYRAAMVRELGGARSMRDLHVLFAKAAKAATGGGSISPRVRRFYEGISKDFRKGFESLEEQGIDFDADLMEQGLIDDEAWIGDGDPTGEIDAETDAFYDRLAEDDDRIPLEYQRTIGRAVSNLEPLPPSTPGDSEIVPLPPATPGDSEIVPLGIADLDELALGGAAAEIEQEMDPMGVFDQGLNPLGVEQDTTYTAGEEIIVDGEVVPTFERAQPGDEEAFSFEEMVRRRQRGVDQGEEVIYDPVVEQVTDIERAPLASPDETGENNWRSTAGNALGLLGSAAGLAQPFVDQYMQKDWEKMLRASARGDTVARQEGAIASGRALQGMMGSSLGRRDISPALAMRNAQNASRNILRDIYGQQLVASANERRISEQQLAKIRSDRWKMGLKTLTQVSSDVGAWLGKEGAKESAGPVTAGMKNSGGGGGDATGQ